MKTILFFLSVLIITDSFAQCIPSVTIQVANGPVCPQNFYVLNAVAINGGTTPSYQWKRNSVDITTFIPSSYTPFFDGRLAQGDVITCIMTSSATCANPISASASYTISYEIPNPNTLSANPAGPISPGTMVTFSATLAYGSTYTIFSRFFVNGIEKSNGYNGTFSTNTLNDGDVVKCISYRSAVINPCGIGDTSNSIVMSVSAVLPIHLSKFVAKPSDNKIILNWATATEINSAYFNVQESLDDTLFTTIGKVGAAGNSITEQSYSYNFYPIVTSTKPFYFRLQMVDKDGGFSYSATQTTSISKGFEVTVSPNPAKNIIYINGTDIKLIQLLDMAGKLVLSKNPALNNTPINMSNLAAGMYLLRATNTNGEVQVKKILLQK